MYMLQEAQKNEIIAPRCNIIEVHPFVTQMHLGFCPV